MTKTINPCIKCGCAERNKRGRCVACAKASRDNYRFKNVGRVKERISQYRLLNQEKIKKADAEYRKNNREKMRAATKAWDVANSAYVREKAIAWAKNNPEKRRINENNRRARMKAVGGVLSHGLSARLFSMQRGKCACCAQPLGADYHMDHIMPLALGGENTDDNIQLLRRTCNLHKSAKDPIDYMQAKGLLL